MMKALILAALALSIGAPAHSENTSLFSDQEQYELFYEYKYQANFVERLVFECTADRDAWWKFAYSTAPISNAYLRVVLGTSVFNRDPFTNQKFVDLVWQQVFMDITRSSENGDGDPAEPSLMAQRDVLRLTEEYAEDLDALCDFIFWEEVARLEQLIDQLYYDVRLRSDSDTFADFRDRGRDGLVVLQRLFDANPLSISEP